MQKNLKLTIELVPSSSWYNNLRKILKPYMWDNIRRNVYKKYKFKCAICRTGGTFNCHEVWEYDDINHIQKLQDLIALCSMCHAVKHIGYAGIQASEGKIKFENLVKHFIRVNNCNRETFDKHRIDAFRKFEERSKYEWQLDLNFLKNFNNK